MMNVDKFTDELIAKLTEATSQFQFQHHIALKNNGCEMHGIRALSAESNIGPVLYMDALYESYLCGTDFKELVQRALSDFRRVEIPHLEFLDNIDDFSVAKSLLRLEVVNLEWNKQSLAERPYTRILDLACQFYLECRAEDNFRIPVHNNLFSKWNVSVQEVFRIAYQNTELYRPLSVRPMDDILNELLTKANIVDEDVDSLLACLSNEDDSPMGGAERIPMLVLTNVYTSYGACGIIYLDYLQKVADSLDSDLYILPSSIHECILVPTKAELHSVSEMQAMVQDINRTQVSTIERLSNNIYYYSRANRELSFAK